MKHVAVDAGAEPTKANVVAIGVPSYSRNVNPPSLIDLTLVT
jgi:hypothetical protein